MAVVQAIYDIYLRTHHLRNLPKGFHEVCRDLPLAQDTLRLVGQQLRGLALDGSSVKALRPLVIECQGTATSLLYIFREFEKEVKNFNDRSLLDFSRMSYDMSYDTSPRFRWELSDQEETLMGDFLRRLNELSNLCQQEVQSNEDQKTRVDILRKLYTSPYLDRKDKNPYRVPGTCEWFVGHRDFQRWRESKSSSMLWVSANPGAGKSVLAKYLVDSELLESTGSRTICYFFFKDDFEDQRSAKSAISCILHQLFTRREHLLSDEIVKRLKAHEANSARSFDELWELLLIVSQDTYIGELVCILDAFDECEDEERIKFAQALRMFYGMKNDAKDNANLKFLITSRPYNKVRRDFQSLDVLGFPVIHLKGESDAETLKITQEIDIYIEDRVSRIRETRGLETAEERLLLQELRRFPNQTYLWVHFFLESIERGRYFSDYKIRKAASSLPRNVDYAYEKLLSKSQNVEEAKRLLHIIVAARRPLTLAEMNVALALKKNHTCYSDLHLMPELRFRDYITDLCGLFVTVINSKIYLLHQTAKEFLVRKSDSNPRRERLTWKYSLSLPESHRILSQICIWHLLFTEFETHPLSVNLDGDLEGEVSRYLHGHVFLDYSATNWAAHFRLSDKGNDVETRDLVWQICDPSSRRFRTWFRIYCASVQMDFSEDITRLIIASHFGLDQIVKSLIDMDDIEIDAVDGTYHFSALFWASLNGFAGIVKLLIEGSMLPSDLRIFEKGADVNKMDRYGRTPLSYASLNGHMDVINLLTDAGARVDSKDEFGGTPVSYALCCGHTAVADQLMKGAQIDSVDKILQDLLFSTAEKGEDLIVERLLENGAAIEVVDSNGRTPLSWAAAGGHEAIVKLLVDRRAMIETMDSNGRTPLSYAAEHGSTAIVKLLLDKSATTLVVDSNGRAPLSYAAENGNMDIVQLLLDRSAANLVMDGTGRTPLSYAAEKGHQAIHRLLLATSKAEVRSKLDTIELHSLELDHQVQGYLLDPGSSDAGNATEMISKPDS
ncbi:unnamed protein product, partial [Clonostachys byssicola]